MSPNKKPKTIDPDSMDPSVYYYDEVYDDMKNEELNEQGKQSKAEKVGKGCSKYIQGLIETADLRKTENELRKFKKYARDREEAEAEGLLSDADVYITAAYERKLKEMKQLSKEKNIRLQNEESNKMNFTKINSNITEKTKEPCQTEENHKRPVIVPDTNCDTTNLGTKHESNQTESNAEEKVIKKPLKTLDDRRHYLRELLVKRTVGPVFEAAQERYRQRRLLKQ